LYEPGAEWGGRVEGVKHIGTDIILSGPTWRGLLARKIISPPAGQAYKTITAVDANVAIATLVGASLGDLFAVSAVVSGITVSGSFRYVNLLGGIQSMLSQYGARLVVAYADGVVTLSAEPVADLSSESEMSQDYPGRIETETNEAKAYNHVIALGSGELTARTVVELYRDDAGTISATPLPTGIEDKQIVLDYPNAESTEELTNSATDRLIEYSPINAISIDLTDVQGLNLGDVVGGRDYVTNLSISKPVTQMIRRVSAAGEKIEYKVGD